jgi:hypothetical protein
MTFNCTYRNRTRISRIQNAFRIQSTDGNVFSSPGDSGSLIFDQAAGRLNGTRPVVGLLYAGGTLGDGTPFTDACDINAVFGALNLETVCTCVARAIIRAIFGERAREAGDRAAGGTSNDLRRPERELRKFRSRVLAESKYGRVLNELISEDAALAGRILAADDAAFAAAVGALQPLRHEVSYLELLDRPIDAQTVERLTELTEHVARRDRELGKRLKTVMGTLRALEGSTLGHVLEAGVEDAKRQRATRRRRPRG